MGQQFFKADVGFIPGFSDLDVQEYFLKNCAYTGIFIGLLFLLSWWCGQSGFEQRLGPLEAANEERDAAIKERDDAQKAWAEMGTKHERAIITILELRDELNKVSKDLPWLNKRHSELAEENIVQNNEIQELKIIQRKFNDLLHDVSAYGMTAKRPEHYQQMCENVQRRLEISNNHLQRSEQCVKALKEKLEAQHNMSNKEKAWLQAKLKQNARSVAYWAKFRTTRVSGRALGSTPAWGVRCACTEPEVAYGLKDQTPRIVELEAAVKARDDTIINLRASYGNAHKNGTSSASNTAKGYLSPMQDPVSDITTGSRPAMTDLVHARKHEQQRKNLECRVADDAKTIRRLREECQQLRDAAASIPTADTAKSNAKANVEEEFAAKDAAIRQLQDENAKADQELVAKNREVKNFREEKRSAEENAAKEISILGQKLSDTRGELADAYTNAAQREQELGQQKARVDELETAQNELKDVIKEKELEIDDLEKANQEIAEQPAPESAETLQRLRTAETDLDLLRRQHAECQERSETQTSRISTLEAAGRELEATTQLKNDRIATLEEEISRAPTIDLIEHQNKTHNETINKKDREYYELYHHWKHLTDHQQFMQNKYNEKKQALNMVQQNDNAKQLQLQQMWTEYSNFRNVHANCDGRIDDLTKQVSQGANALTDLQVKHNTQATQFDEVNQTVLELRSEVTTLQSMNANLGQTNSSSDTDIEKYRLEGEDRARPTWQANFDREISLQARKLEASQGRVFKLENQLQQAKVQATPLREMQLQSREDAVKLREDALKHEIDAMDHDQQGSNADPEVRSLEKKLAAANKEAGDGRLRNRNIQLQLNKGKKERQEEKEKHERELKREQEDAKKKGDILRIRLEKDNPLKGMVSTLQNEVMRLKKELEERK